MTIQIQYVNVKNGPRLEAQINERLQKLEKKYTWMVGARIFLKNENFAAGKDKICEVDVSVPGPNIFAKAAEDTFATAIAAAFNDLEKLLRKHKDKMYKN